MDDRDVVETFRRWFALPTRLSDEPAGDDERNHFAEFYGGAPLNSVANRITRHSAEQTTRHSAPLSWDEVQS